ncbi:unnamed protein product [Umbelopsis ramanniana]
MDDERDCDAVIDHCDRMVFGGVTIRVSFAERERHLLPHQHDDIILDHTCQVCGGIGHTAIECPTRHRAMAASVALAHGIERPRGDTGATNTTSFGSHSRHLSDEIRMERPILRRPLSGDQSDFPQRRREYQTRPDTHRRSLSNRSAYERPSQRDNHTSLRPNNYLNSSRDDRDQRGIPDGPRYHFNRSSARFFDQNEPNRPGRRPSLPDYQRPTRDLRSRSRTPPPRGPARRNGPVPRPYGEEEHTRNGINNSSQSQTTHNFEDREARRSTSPPHHPRNFRGPRTPSPEQN